MNDDFNFVLNQKLIESNSWRISNDIYNKSENFIHDEEYSKKYSDAGLLLLSYSQEKGIPDTKEQFEKYSFFNHCGEIIFNSILNQSQYYFKNISLHRFLWNYYHKSSVGTFHIDSNMDNMYSIVYYVNSNDGYTEIKDYYKCKSESGSAILFKSNHFHRGNGPTNSLQRYCLNILFEADGYERK